MTAIIHPALEVHDMPLSVSEAARRLGVKPQAISNLFYRRMLRDDLAPIICGRRAIPEDYLPQIAAVLRRNGIVCRDVS